MIRCDNRYFGEQCETNYDDIINKQNSKMIKNRKQKYSNEMIFVLDTILLFKSRFLAGCILFLIGFILLLIAFLSCILARTNQKSSKTTIHNKMEQPSPIARKITTKETSTETDDYNISTKINKIEEINNDTKTNHLILSEGYLEFYQPDAESGLIRPLRIRSDTPEHYSKDISFHNRFVLPR